MKRQLAIAELVLPIANLRQPVFMVVEMFGKRINDDCGHWHRDREKARACQTKWLNA